MNGPDLLNSHDLPLAALQGEVVREIQIRVASEILGPSTLAY